jgi:hypothetical protein
MKEKKIDCSYSWLLWVLFLLFIMVLLLLSLHLFGFLLLMVYLSVQNYLDVYEKLANSSCQPAFQWILPVAPPGPAQQLIILDQHPPPPPPQPLLPPACRPFNPDWPILNLGRMDVHALHWMAEHLTASSRINPRFMCCLSGKIVLPPLEQPPPELLHLLTAQDDIGNSFCDHIRTYNNALTMTSISHKIDESVNNGPEAVNDGFGPYVFKLHGELSHRSGSLLPPKGQSSVYAQLYIYDPTDSMDCCMENSWNAHLHHNTLATLKECQG